MGVGEFVRRVGVDRNSLIGIVQARNEVDHFGPCHGPVEVEERIGGIVCDSRRIGADRIGELSDQRLRNGILYLQEPVTRILAQDFGIAAVEHRQRVRTDVRRPVGEDEVGIVQFFLEVFDPLQGIAVRRLDPGGVGLHQGEAEQG